MHYITKSEYSTITGISRPTVDKWIKQGKIETKSIEGGADVIMLEDTEYEKIKGKGIDNV